MVKPEEREKLPPTKVLEAILSYHANVYVTVLNVIQCIALYLLATETRDILVKEDLPEELVLPWILRSLVALVMILVVWHRYVCESQYLWPMSWQDTLTPFFMGITEFTIIFFANPQKTPLPWFALTIVIFEVIVALAYFNAYLKRKSPFTERLYQDFYSHYPQYATDFLAFMRQYAWDNIKNMGWVFLLSLAFMLVIVLFPVYRQEITFPIGCIAVLLYREILYGFDRSIRNDKSIGHHFQ